jgi:hypothetical protein
MGDIFGGNNHGEAYDRLKARYPGYDPKLIIEGVITPDGRFLTREEIARKGNAE